MRSAVIRSVFPGTFMFPLKYCPIDEADINASKVDFGSSQ